MARAMPWLKNHQNVNANYQTLDPNQQKTFRQTFNTQGKDAALTYGRGQWRQPQPQTPQTPPAATGTVPPQPTPTSNSPVVNDPTPPANSATNPMSSNNMAAMFPNLSVTAPTVEAGQYKTAQDYYDPNWQGSEAFKYQEGRLADNMSKRMSALGLSGSGRAADLYSEGAAKLLGEEGERQWDKAQTLAEQYNTGVTGTANTGIANAQNQLQASTGTANLAATNAANMQNLLTGQQAFQANQGQLGFNNNMSLINTLLGQNPMGYAADGANNLANILASGGQSLASLFGAQT